jgi:hypothetical protein
VVPHGQNVDALAEEFGPDLGGDADPAGGVLPVGHDEVNDVFLA